MPVYPEKLSGKQEARGAIGAQFWGQAVQSARSLDGQCQTLPCEPQPLALAAASGLNRVQQLLAAQAVVAPAIPSFSGADGGVVLDRVMLRCGGKAWWAALAARARAQRMVDSHRRGRSVGEVVRDLNSYSLAARIRSEAGKHCAVNALLELPNVHEFREAVESSGLVSALGSGLPLAKGWATAKWQLPKHELQAAVSRNLEHLDSAAAYCHLPLAASLDLASQPRSDGIQYRAGLHQVSAPAHEAFGGRRPAQGGPHRSLHLQGAVGVEGQALLWRAGAERGGWGEAHDGVPGLFADELPEQPELSSAGEGGPPAGPRELPPPPEWLLPIEEPAAADASEEEAPPARLPPFGSISARLARPRLRARRLGLRGGGEDPAAVEAARVPSASSFRLQGPAGKAQPRLQAEEPQSQFAEWEQMLGSGPVLEGFEPARLQSRLVRTEKAITAARHALSGLLSAKRSMQIQRSASGRSGGPRAKRTPYSPLLAEPHIKVNGAVGCLARVPLPVESFSLRGGSQPGGRWSAERWTPHLRDTALRVFASCGLSAQAGRFTKRFADYTAASVRLDFGLTSPEAPVDGGVSHNGHSPPPASPPQVHRHRAFALEGRGVWHAASLSLGQQIFGPLRARLDTRLAFDASVQGRGEGRWGLSLRSLAARAPWLQPVKLETVAGLDMVVPGTGGVARACAWYSPTRREGMLELRLL